MRPGIMAAALFAVGAVLLLAVLGEGPAAAAGLLTNGGFESWDGPGAPSGWNVGDGTTVAEVSTPAVGAAALRMTGSGLVSQSAAALAGGGYVARIDVQGEAAAGTARLRLRFFDGTLIPVGQSQAERQLTTGWQTIEVDVEAPPGAAFVVFEAELVGAAAVAFFDEASLEETAPGSPTPTPDDLDTPTPAPTTTTAQPSRTPRPTRTPTPYPQDEGRDAPVPGIVVDATATPTPWRTPTAPKPVPPPPGTTFGGLLVNGDFELAQGGQPMFWTEVGGELFGEGPAYRGERAAILLSDSAATKWIYQAAPVEAGRWYRATAQSRLATDDGEVFIRLSWYWTPDASGTLLSSVDSPAVSSTNWTLLDTGAVQAPPGAKSVRVRLVLRPHGPGTALFDDAALVAVAAPPPAPASPTPMPTPAIEETVAALQASHGGEPVAAARAADPQPGSPVEAVDVPAGGPGEPAGAVAVDAPASNEPVARRHSTDAPRPAGEGAPIDDAPAQVATAARTAGDGGSPGFIGIVALALTAAGAAGLALARTAAKRGPRGG